MRMDGLAWAFEQLNKLSAGICPGCQAKVTYPALVCSEPCKRKWFNQIIADVGETKRVTSSVTGKTYLVPPV